MNCDKIWTYVADNETLILGNIGSLISFSRNILSWIWCVNLTSLDALLLTLSIFYLDVPRSLIFWLFIYNLNYKKG